MAVTCSGITKAGSRCTRPALSGQPFCLMHSPDAADLRREASRKGGRNRSATARARAMLPEAMDAAEVASWLSLALKQTLAGKLDVKIGVAVATIGRAILEARQAAELDELSAEVERLRVELRRQGRSAA